jgi:hypothetical protein
MTPKVGADHPLMNDLEKPKSATSPPGGRTKTWGALFGLRLALLVNFLVSYVIIPGFWRGYTKRHRTLAGLPGITLTGRGHPDGPVKVSLTGSEDVRNHIMQAAKIGHRSVVLWQQVINIPIS